jgi:hypothetical protein
MFLSYRWHGGGVSWIKCHGYRNLRLEWNATKHLSTTFSHNKLLGQPVKFRTFWNMIRVKWNTRNILAKYCQSHTYHCFISDIRTKSLSSWISFLAGILCQYSRSIKKINQTTWIQIWRSNVCELIEQFVVGGKCYFYYNLVCVCSYRNIKLHTEIFR